MLKESLVLVAVCGVLPGMLMWAQDSPAPASGEQQKQRTPRPPKPGVSTPGVRREMTSITPDAIYMVPGNPDWQVSTEDAQWVTSSSVNTVHPAGSEERQGDRGYGGAVALFRTCGGLRKRVGSELWQAGPRYQAD